jgi:hypothetical protein
MMPPMTTKASTRTKSAAITSFVLVSMAERMMHKAAPHRSLPDGGPSCRLASARAGVTRRCDVDQAPRGPLARRTHLTGRRPGARGPSIPRGFDLCGVRRSRQVGAIQEAPALEALEDGTVRRVGPTVSMTVIATRRGECQRDHAIGPSTPAKDQRRGILPPVPRRVCSLPHQGGPRILGASEAGHTGVAKKRRSAQVPGPGIEPGRGFPPSGF